MNYNFLKNTYKQIEWISVIDSWKKWKNIWIFALTHWNEPVWLEVINYLINEFDIKKNILIWKIYFICVNLKAYKKYISQDDFLNYRFVNHNMNRIYKKDFVRGSYEFERLEELKIIFDEIDVVLDLHSVAAWNNIIWITNKKQVNIAKDIFDVENILVDDIASSWAMIGYFIDNCKMAFGIECWNHIWKTAYKNWIRNVLNFLSYFGVIDYKIQKEIKLNWVFGFLNEIFPKSFDFKHTKKFINFDKIWINEVYARDKDYEYKNTFDKEIFIALVWKKVKPGEGNWFLFEKII